MAGPRTQDEITKDYNQKLHRLGTLHWQTQHLIPQEIEQIEKQLKDVEREAQILSRMQSKKTKTSDQAKEDVAAEVAIPEVAEQVPQQ